MISSYRWRGAATAMTLSMLVAVTGCGSSGEPRSTPTVSSGPIGAPSSQGTGLVHTLNNLQSSPGVNGGPVGAPSSQGTGFVHTVNNSRFHIGSNPQSVSEFGMSKIVGSDGVFGTVTQTGWVLAIPNAVAPSTLVAPLTRSPDSHNKTVLEYFIGAGLPSDQVLGTQAMARMKGGGQGAYRVSNGEFAGYMSVVTRQVAGISVPDSFAWARFNINGEVIEEQVYWPSIPQAAIVDAKALQAVVAEPARYASFQQKLPADLPAGQIVIHHTSGSAQAGFAATASYDVNEPGEMRTVRHFDQNAVEFKLASESVASQVQGSSKSSR